MRSVHQRPSARAVQLTRKFRSRNSGSMYPNEAENQSAKIARLAEMIRDTILARPGNIVSHVDTSRGAGQLFIMTRLLRIFAQKKSLRLSFSPLAVCAASFILSACQTTRPIVGPDGTEHQLISCGAIERCYEQATAVCAGQYRIVNTSSEVSGSEGSTYTTVKLLVKCGK